MKIKLLLGGLLLSPVFSHAHDGEHIALAWYKNPIMLSLLLLAFGLFVWLAYGWSLENKRQIFIPAIGLLLIALVGLTFFNQNYTSEETVLAVENLGRGETVTLYKSPNCGCCTGHAEALEAAGFTVNIIETNELDDIKTSQNIPPEGASCHTSVIAGYTVEGHVPLAAIEKLLTEKPDIAGIGLPGMPIGTPGMPGKKTAPYEVYQLTGNGQMSPYMTI